MTWIIVGTFLKVLPFSLKFYYIISSERRYYENKNRWHLNFNGNVISLSEEIYILTLNLWVWYSLILCFKCRILWNVALFCICFIFTFLSLVVYVANMRNPCPEYEKQWNVTKQNDYYLLTNKVFSKHFTKWRTKPYLGFPTTTQAFILLSKTLIWAL